MKDNKNYLTEAFQALKDLELNEDVFEITDAGIEQASDFAKADEIEEFEDIIDPLAQTEEELKDSYLGKAILDCEVCHSKLYKDPEEVVIDEEAQLANLEEACPYCQSNEGFKVIGQVAEYCPHCDHEDEEHTDAEEKEVEIESEEEIDESIKTKKGISRLRSVKESSKRDDIDADADDKKEIAKKKFIKAKDSADSDRDYKLKKKGLKESNTVWDNDTLYKIVKDTKDNKFYILKRRNSKNGFLNDRSKEKFDTPEEAKTALKDLSKLHFYIDESLKKKGLKESIEDIVRDIQHNEQTRVSSWTDDGEITIDSDQLYTTDIDWLCRRLRQKGYNCTPISTRTLKLDIKKDLDESDKPAATSIEDAQKWVDYDMKKYGRISGRTNRLVKKAGFQILKDNHGDYEVAAGKFESVNEEVEKVDIETESDRVTMEQDENGKVVVTTEPKEATEIEDAGEVIAPVEPETEEKFKVEDDFEEVDFDEFEETDFDALGEKYLKRVYENVKSFKTTQGSLKGNQLKLEGLITFKSGKEAKTNFIFEAHTISKTGKLKFLGENKQFAKGKKSFTLTGSKQGNKLMMESLTYNYRGKDASTNKSQRLYGRVSR